jgi:hypothetical protein
MKLLTIAGAWQGAVGLHGFLTTGRTEITALDDKLNEAARPGRPNSCLSA